MLINSVRVWMGVTVSLNNMEYLTLSKAVGSNASSSFSSFFSRSLEGDLDFSLTDLFFEDDFEEDLLLLSLKEKNERHFLKKEILSNLEGVKQ